MYFFSKYFDTSMYFLKLNSPAYYRMLTDISFFNKTALTRWLYEHIKIPVLPPYGGLPVKFRTYIGEPIPYDPNITAEELAKKVRLLNNIKYLE